MPLLYCSQCKGSVDLAVPLSERAPGGEGPTKVYVRPNGEKLTGPAVCPSCGADHLEWY